MQWITELLVRAANLAEAEGRLLRMIVARMLTSFGITLVASGALLAGVLALLASLHLAVSQQAGTAVGALVTGLVAVFLGGGLAWAARRMLN